MGYKQVETIVWAIIKSERKNLQQSNLLVIVTIDFLLRFELYF